MKRNQLLNFKMEMLKVPTMTGNSRALKYFCSQGILGFDRIAHSPTP